MLQPMERQPSKETNTAGYAVDVAVAAGGKRWGDLIRWQSSSKFMWGPRQRRSSTASKTGTSSRKVARVRNNKASSHALKSDSESNRALLIDGCQVRQSLGMSSRWGY